MKKAGATCKVCIHLTGCGFYENIPRMLPENVSAKVKKGSFEIPPIFALMQRCGSLEEQMMYNTYNMGLGMVLAVDAAEADRTIAALKDAGEKAWAVGEVVAGGHEVLFS